MWKMLLFILGHLVCWQRQCERFGIWLEKWLENLWKTSNYHSNSLEHFALTVFNNYVMKCYTKFYFIFVSAANVQINVVH